MKNSRIKIWLAATLLCLTGFTGKLKSQATEGEMTFSVRTVTANGDHSPKHVLAIWVEDAEGFVLTRKLEGNKRKEYLYTWNTNSGGNVTDATTGETLLEHQTHSVTWDCRDVDGNLVPDGAYTVYIEFTEEHAQGPLRMVPFNKGTETVSLSPEDDTHFKDLTLSFVPNTATNIVDRSGNTGSDFLQIYPNPTHGMVFVQVEPASSASILKIFKMNGSLISSRNLNDPGIYQIDLAGFENGSYIFQVESEQQTSGYVIVKE